MPKKSPEEDDIDRVVGIKVRQRRLALDKSQGAVGEAVGVTFQQIQKNEQGTNRIGAGRLWLLAGALSCPVTYFYEGLDRGGEKLDAHSKAVIVAVEHLLRNREGQRLALAFHRMDKSTRVAFLTLAETCNGKKRS